MLTLTFNENGRGLQGYPATIISIERPHFLFVQAEGCRDVLRVTPGHFEEEDEIVAHYGFERP